MTRSIATVILALAVTGCIHHHSGIPKASAPKKNEWKSGITTRREVVEKWGNPHGTAGNTWIWRIHTTTGGKVKAAYRMIGVTISNLDTTSREHRLTFDSDGILTDWQVSDSVLGGVRWSPWPF